ncbi:MAG: DNA mismatch endonuclease Vsr [Xanthomonadales bacterium]|nr:DNA mismatch endonuclease Vsr [Xanthomonadales bacterium]
MADVVDARTRSRMMSRIKGKNTRPELALRKALHARGFRYRLHARHVAGHPDLILPRHGAVVLVHGCFWHRHEGCRYTTVPSTRPEFWQMKFDANRRRDREVLELLQRDGWRVATVWECALRRPEQVSSTTDELATWIRSESPEIELP